MIYILSSVLDNQKASKNSFQATTFKVKENSRTFQGKMEYKDFSRLCEPCFHIMLHFFFVFVFFFTLDLSNHVLSVWQIEKKKTSTAVQYIEFI